MNMILDGTGDGYRAKVDSNNRLHTDSSSISQADNAGINGDGYNINTGSIVLTSDSESGIAYISYTGTGQFVIKEIIVIIGSTTGGSGDGVVEIIRNPTAGDTIDNAVEMDSIINRDFSSNKAFTGVAYKGAEGDTLNSGETFANTTRSSFGTVVTFDAGVIVLGKSNSVGVSYTPPTGNTSQSVRVAFTAYEIKETT